MSLAQFPLLLQFPPILPRLTATEHGWHGWHQELYCGKSCARKIFSRGLAPPANVGQVSSGRLPVSRDEEARSDPAPSLSIEVK